MCVSRLAAAASDDRAPAAAQDDGPDVVFELPRTALAVEQQRSRKFSVCHVAEFIALGRVTGTAFVTEVRGQPFLSLSHTDALAVCI